uniref:Fe2OG dioxygenase domain-containing protein n=1 Tax=Knipowitschia caucasica TaxID=637954 RepID=A0AAV2J353_KNICA
MAIVTPPRGGGGWGGGWGGRGGGGGWGAPLPPRGGGTQLSGGGGRGGPPMVPFGSGFPAAIVMLRRSVVASGVKQATADYRISKSAWLKDSSHAVIEKLDLRISMVTGLNVNHPFGEYLQVVNYGIGGHYEPHFDHATAPTSPVYKLNTGNRVATFMIYLSSVEAGGSTAFIYANFSLPVVEKAAVFWWNLHRNGEGNVDTLHAGCPVLVGDKWVANKWIHEYGQEFIHRCTLNRDE